MFIKAPESPSRAESAMKSAEGGFHKKNIDLLYMLWHKFFQQQYK